MPGPLEGIRVIELGVWVAGPAAGGILADWGADVVKIEPPDRRPGAPVRADDRQRPRRSTRRSSSTTARSAASCSTSTTDDGHALVARPARRRRRLPHQHPDGRARAARPRPAQRCCAHNPRLVYGIITGYGLEGAERDRAAYDLGAFWARVGHRVGCSPRPGARRRSSAAAWATTASPWTSSARSAPGSSRATAGGTGRGPARRRPRCCARACTRSASTSTRTCASASPIAIGRTRRWRTRAMNCYRASDDRWFWLIGLEGDRHWPPLCRAVGHPEWIDDPRFATPARARENVREMIGELRRGLRRRVPATSGPRRSTARACGGRRCRPPRRCSPTRRLGRRRVPRGARRGEHGHDGQQPCDFVGTPTAARWMPPELGEHTDEILGELGRSPQQIDALRASGAVR